MSEVESQDSKKTLVAFVVGLLIGGMLVWAFGGSSSETPKDATNETEVATEEPTSETESTDGGLAVGTADIKTGNQVAGAVVKIESATYPHEEGWIAVRDYTDGKEGFVLGAARFSKADGLVPSEVVLLRPTVAGNTYALSIYKENGDNKWGNDEKVDGVFGTFTAE
jgi:hypothetical protein